MLFSDYASRWVSSLPDFAQSLTFGQVSEGGREYPLVGLSARGSRSVVITAGFHGDEKAGPMTLLEHASEIVAYAAERDVGLAIYPCVNPSGFEAHTRYNVTGEHPNNDFLRYETTPGTWRGELRAGEEFLRVTPVGDGDPEGDRGAGARARRPSAAPGGAGPAPGQLHPRVAVLRLHLRRPRELPPHAGPFGRARTVLRNALVDSGHEPGTDVHADGEGFIVCHDGSVTDRFHRAGVPYTAAIETTTETPWPLADEINLIWIRGFIDLAAAA